MKPYCARVFEELGAGQRVEKRRGKLSKFFKADRNEREQPNAASKETLWLNC